MTQISIQIDPNKRYNIEEVATLTGYSTGYIRDLERHGKVPPAQRDEKNWRFWMGDGVLKILEYKGKHVVSLPIKSKE